MPAAVDLELVAASPNLRRSTTMNQLARHQLPRHVGEHRHRRGDRALRRAGGATSSICGMYGYQERAGARAEARKLPFFEGQRARPYRCTDGCGQWHVGYLPELVVQGVVTAAEWYGHAGHKPMGELLLSLITDVRTATGGELTFERRRVEPVDGDDYDLWGAMIDVAGTTYLARDYDNPTQATAAALDELAAARTETEPLAA